MLATDAPTPDPDVLAQSLPAAECIAQHVQTALVEDLGSGDITAALLPAGQRGRAELITREMAVLSGRAWFDGVFRALDPHYQADWQVRDGERLMAGQRLCVIEGGLRELLSGERTAMNFLQVLSGTATRARRYADAVAGLPTRILDTRKTLPGLRAAQKYAVLCGGCDNHRMGLFDAILIKENHIMAAGSIAAAVAAARATAAGVRVEVEVENLDELEQALTAGAERVLLDNFGLHLLREAVTLTAGRARLEASGGISLTALRAIAETGVDDISVGDLTKSVEAVDLSLRLSPSG
ncbi:carboxylating nicotinate-nucleotide diphosphorylase [Rhabdochromatium marinum]|uniref:carboxylating nicotinate-nucleotide diphosphorylase n=1 Tax=Rhabdochromatium marinum TaxID=48729 RepID=UPI0019078CEC|nr:carboxylating nicotinate-nucleotide diphosphorylase [Rhabdochromatium marinum]MBK1648320.1 nicotinate-nucleotide diphosphorylase (carboxylating) [Rhabdochromatium marinum]